MKKIIVNSPETIEGFRVVDNGEEILKCLQNGETVMHWEGGHSMHPILMHMEYCKITPIEKLSQEDKDFSLEFLVGKPEFCPFNYPGYGDVYMVHRCTEIIQRDDETYYKIEGTDGTQFGWTTDVYGIAESTGYFQNEKAVSWS